MSENQNGTIQVYTGNGKGKTTAALGLALRFLGHNKKVCIVQFMKNSESYGEFISISQFSNVEIYPAGRDQFVDKTQPEAQDIELAQEGYQQAMECMGSEEFDLLILDEVNVAIDFNLIEVEQILELIDEKPEHVELVLTGRYADDQIKRQADLVSEVKEVKHHFASGVGARKGIEY